MKSDIITDDTLYNEIYALIKLKHVFTVFNEISIKDKINNKTESPDFQSFELDCGIEVTRALPDYVEKKLVLLRNLSGKNKTPEDFDKFVIDKKLNKKIKNNLIVIEDYNGHTAVSNKDDNIIAYIDAIRTALIKKNTIFLNDSFLKFKTNYLFIRCEYNIIVENDLLVAMNGIKINYDIVFFDCGKILYEYVVKTNIINRYELNDEELIEIKKYAINN